MQEIANLARIKNKKARLFYYKHPGLSSQYFYAGFRGTLCCLHYHFHYLSAGTIANISLRGFASALS